MIKLHYTTYNMCIMVIYDDRDPPKSSTVILVVGIRRWFGISVAHRIIIFGFQYTHRVPTDIAIRLAQVEFPLNNNPFITEVMLQRDIRYI